MHKKEFKNLYTLILKEKTRKADAIVWLQGDRYDRAAKVLELYRQGWSEKILISGNNVLVGKKGKLGENNIPLSHMQNFLLRKGIKMENVIIDNNAMNTKEQAEHVLKIAKKRKWKSLILVGSSYYQPRVFLTFLKRAKKIKRHIAIINQPAIISWNKKPAGRDKAARFFFDEECEKIKKYKKDLATITQGINYLKQFK